MRERAVHVDGKEPSRQEGGRYRSLRREPDGWRDGVQEAGAARAKENVEKRSREETRRACWLFEGLWLLTKRGYDVM